MHKKICLVFFLLSLLTGCALGEKSQQITIEEKMKEVFSYEIIKVEQEHSENINEWLIKARQTGLEGQYFTLQKDKNDYMYTYVYGKGFSDYDVSFIYNPSDSKFKTRIHIAGIKGNSDSEEEAFVKIKSIYDLSSLFILSDETLEKILDGK